jgi:hypothetical protein
MTAPQAALPAQRRLSRGLFGALVAYLVILPFPPLLLFGPLAGLLAVSRPGTIREWLWLGLAALVTGLALAAAPSAMTQEVSLAYAAGFTGAFVALLVWQGGPVLRRAAVAAILAALTVAVGCAVLGITWSGLTGAFRDQLQLSLAAVVDESALPAEQAAAAREVVDLMARIYPGLAVLGAMVGGTLAAAVSHRIAARPATPAPGRFRDFRFNDHLIWGALATFGVFMLPLPAPWGEILGNLMVVWTGLYLGRGVAIAADVMAPWPGVPRVALFLSAVLLLRYALGVLLLAGVADTWIDIRRAVRPSPSGGSES